MLNDKHQIDIEQRADLLRIQEVGKERMSKYVRQYVLDPPTEVRQKRERKKLKTFSKVRTTLKTQKSKVSRLTKMTKSLLTRLQQSGQFYDRVLEYPLAICDEYGNMRSRNKSSFKDALLDIAPLNTIFKTILPIDIQDTATEIIIDGLKYIHIPPAPSVQTCADYSRDLFKRIVTDLGVKRGISVITVVFDKPSFLPKIRDAIHKERKKGQSTGFVCPSKLTDESNIPHGRQFMEALTDKKFKSLLLHYICASFTSLALNMPEGHSLIIDSPTFGKVPVCVQNGVLHQLDKRENSKGEADFGIWFHATCSDTKQIIIHAEDTDIYMYGIDLCGCGVFVRKNVVVERIINTDYVHVSMMEDNSLLPEKCSVTSLLAIYLLSGSDYLSGFFKLTNAFILSVFLKYINFISPEENQFISKETKHVNIEGFIRLMCCVYLEKHLNLYKHLYTTPVEIWNGLQADDGDLSQDMITFLEWLQYDIPKERTMSHYLCLKTLHEECAILIVMGKLIYLN